MQKRSAIAASLLAVEACLIDYAATKGAIHAFTKSLAQSLP